MKTARLLSAVVLVGTAVAAVALLATPETPSVAAAPMFTSPAQCAACHTEIAREAADSWHGKAYTDPEVLALSRNFQDEQCISCHAPAPIFGTGIGERVFERRDSRETGVDCVSCHLLPNGAVAGTRGLSAPCRPEKDARLSTAAFCAGCHNQHWTVDEYMASEWAKTKTCNDCHMPRSNRPLADGGPVREGVASHAFPGGHSLAMLKEALRLEASVAGDRLEIRVTNVGAGHKAPTDSRHKSYNVLLTVTDEAGNLLEDRREIAEYRLYYRDQNIESTQVSPGETRTHWFDLPTDRRGRARVELVYCQKPPQKLTGDFTPVHEVEVPF